MSILYYPNRVYRAKVPAIDRVMDEREPIMATGSQNVFSTALNAIISMEDNWQLDSVALTFSNANSRSFNAYIRNGRKIVENLNDYLWIEVSGCGGPQRIIMNPGFYTGTQLATELQARLNANAAYIAAGVTFIVTYVAATGLYIIVPSAGTIRYLDVHTGQLLPLRDSIAGHLFGLNATSAFAANVTSDTTVFGLDAEVSFINQTNNTDVSYLHTDIHTMSVDQAVHLASNTGADVTVSYVVVYEDIV